MTEVSLVSTDQKIIQDSIQAKNNKAVEAEQKRVKDVEDTVDKANEIGKRVDMTV